MDSSKLDLHNPNQYDKEILVALTDDNDLFRSAIGKDEKGLYVVDFAEDLQRFRTKLYVKPELTLNEVLRIGLECKAFDQCGIDEYRFEADQNPLEEWKAFCSTVLVCTSSSR